MREWDDYNTGVIDIPARASSHIPGSIWGRRKMAQEEITKEQPVKKDAGLRERIAELLTSAKLAGEIPRDKGEEMIGPSNGFMKNALGRCPTRS